MLRTTVPKQKKSVSPILMRKTSVDIDQKKFMTEQRIAETRDQLEKIHDKMDKCQQSLQNGQSFQKKHAEKTLQYLLKNKKIYEDYLDKLVRDQITIDVLGKAFFPTLEQLNEELELIQEERQDIIEMGIDEEKQYVIANKYTSDFQNELISRSYKVNIDEQELDKQLIPFEEDHQRYILNNINKKIIPDYYKSIMVAKRRITMQ